MKKTVIFTPDAPAPIGPYSQAIAVNGMLYVSGQIAIDPSTGQLLKGSLEAETCQVLRNVGAILKAAGIDYSAVVKSSIFLKDMNDFAEINTVYGEFFPIDPPSRETVEVARLPKDVRIEVSVIAVL